MGFKTAVKCQAKNERLSPSDKWEEDSLPLKLIPACSEHLYTVVEKRLSNLWSSVLRSKLQFILAQSPPFTHMLHLFCAVQQWMFWQDDYVPCNTSRKQNCKNLVVLTRTKWLANIQRQFNLNQIWRMSENFFFFFFFTTKSSLDHGAFISSYFQFWVSASTLLCAKEWF